MRKPTRRQFLRAAALGGVGAALGIGGYSGLIEPYATAVTRLEMPLPGLPEAFDGFRVAQLSDPHFGPYTGERQISAALQKVNAFSPDLVAITGDFITSPWLERATAPVRALQHAHGCAQLLAGLQARAGVYACLGNHDASVNSKGVAEALATGGMAVLRNQSRVIERDGARLWVAGIDDVLYGRPDLGKALVGIPANETVLLLAHEPDFADVAARYPVALQLSGHSHGGQIRVPLLDPLYLPALARKYPLGHYRIRNLQLYTNRGIGTIILPLRFGAPPEVALITLRPER